MPMVNVTAPISTFNEQQRADLAERLTHVLLMIEGGTDTPAGRAIAYVTFSDIEPDRWYVGGNLDDTYAYPGGRVVFDVTVPEGSCNQQRKSRIHDAVNTALCDTLGISPETRHRGASAWVIIHEVREGHWGAGGRSISVRDVAKIAQMAPDRADYYEPLLAARRRLHESLSYPEDAASY